MISSACIIRPRGTWEKRAAHGGSRWGEERVVPPRSHPDALQKKREGGVEEGDYTLFEHHGNLSIAREEVVQESNIKDEEEK